MSFANALARINRSSGRMGRMLAPHRDRLGAPQRLSVQAMAIRQISAVPMVAARSDMRRLPRLEQLWQRLHTRKDRVRNTRRVSRSGLNRAEGCTRCTRTALRLARPAQKQEETGACQRACACQTGPFFDRGSGRISCNYVSQHPRAVHLRVRGLPPR